MPELENAEIERAHRFGNRNSDTCPIIVKFNKYKDKDTILQKAKQNLSRESSFSVREDYTDRVQLHRRELCKRMIEARENGEFAR